MGIEGDLHAGVADVAEDLLNLRSVAMFADTVGGDGFVAFGKQIRQLQCSARSTDATFGINDDAGWFNQPFCQQRRSARMEVLV